MVYTQNTPDEIRAMLEVIGVSSLEDLFAPVPEGVTLKGKLDIPQGLPEPDLLRRIGEIADRNVPLGRMPSFLGAGAYRHHIPSVVDALAGRSEFATSYTPYQAEASQGNLQAIFEYQTLICELLGMDVSNASHYDGATSVAEAAMMALEATGRDEILIPQALHPDFRAVLGTYLRHRSASPVEVPLEDGRTDLAALQDLAGARTAAVIVQTPNFLGLLEEVEEFSRAARDCGALLIASVDPISLGLIAPPGEYGADIAVGEGQALGNPVSFGGPWFGFIAARQKYVRKMPGRIVGETRDGTGRRAFVLTLQAREQHIRREKATSNICTNQGLCALRGAIYLTAIGKAGLRKVGDLCLQKAHYGAAEIAARTPFSLSHPGPYFREFAIQGPIPAAEVNRRLYEKGIIGGYDLEKVYPGDSQGLLLAFTELCTRKDIDALVSALSEVA